MSHVPSTSLATFRLFSPRNLVLFGAVFGLYVGYALRNPLLLFIGATGVLVLVNAWMQARGALRDVRIRRKHSPRAFEGEFVGVDLEFETESATPRSLILLTDYFPPASGSRVRHLMARPLFRRERIRVHYAGECDHRRGAYTIGPVALEAYDDLGMMRRVGSVDTFTQLLVMPSAVDLRTTRVLGDGTLPHVGIEMTPRAGVSEEFVGLREYRPGDAPNTIHWRSSARTGELMVKEFQEEITTEVTLLLDLRRIGAAGLGDQTTTEYAVKAAASIARRSIERGHAVQLYAFASQVEHVPPGAGQSQLLLLLDRLTYVRADGDGDFLDGVRRTTPLLAPGGTAVMLMGATATDPGVLVGAIEGMRRRRLLPVVVLVDDRQFIAITRDQESARHAGVKLPDLVRLLVLHGARVHVVEKAQRRADGLVRGLERPAFAEEAP